MTTLHEQLRAAETEVERIKREMYRANFGCAVAGHQWKFVGCAPCLCAPGGGHSIPVHECLCCGDCDYGDNPEGDHVRATECIENEQQQ